MSSTCLELKVCFLILISVDVRGNVEKPFLETSGKLKPPSSTKHQGAFSGNFFPTSPQALANPSSFKYDSMASQVPSSSFGARKPSKDQFVPALDMKKMSIKKVQDIYSSNPGSIRGNKNHTHHHRQQTQKVMTSHEDQSNLYKQLTQKLMSDQSKRKENYSSFKQSGVTFSNAKSAIRSRDASALSSTTHKLKKSFMFDPNSTEQS